MIKPLNVMLNIEIVAIRFGPRAMLKLGFSLLIEYSVGTLWRR